LGKEPQHPGIDNTSRPVSTGAKSAKIESKKIETEKRKSNKVLSVDPPWQPKFHHFPSA
jgi:hypothetical protein